MNLDGEFQLAAARETVWQALNDLDVLRACIPGCEELTAVTGEHFRAVVRAKTGPVNAKFNTDIHLENVNEPESYTLVVNGKGGAAGMGEGSANVELAENPSGTLLRYSVELKVKGKLAQVGSRLIMNVVRKLSNEFFSKFAAHFPEREKPGQEVAGIADAPAPE